MKRVLYADDEPMLRIAVGGLMTRMRHSVALADSVFSAFREMKSGNFDVIIADLSMPGLKPAGFAKVVRELQPNSQILFVSGDIEVYRKEIATLKGVLGLIQKPFDPKLFKLVLSEDWNDQKIVSYQL